MKISIFRHLTLPISLLAAGALSSTVEAADFGSLRGSNRSAAPAPSAPRQQPQTVRRPVARPVQPPPQRPEQRPQQPPPERPLPRPPQPTPERPDVRPDVRPVAQPRPAEHFQPAPEQVDRARIAQADARRQDIAPEGRQAYFWSDYHKDMRVDRLPDGYSRIGVRGHDFFYFGGVFYDNGPSGYVVVAPPLDAEIPALPPGTETVVVGDAIYYYVAGAFYLQQPDGGFIVVAAPMGGVVSLLPPDATEADSNGIVYYVADGVWYSPVMQNGVTAYAIVPQP